MTKLVTESEDGLERAIGEAAHRAEFASCLAADWYASKILFGKAAHRGQLSNAHAADQYVSRTLALLSDQLIELHLYCKSVRLARKSVKRARRQKKRAA